MPTGSTQPHPEHTVRHRADPSQTARAQPGSRSSSPRHVRPLGHLLAPRPVRPRGHVWPTTRSDPRDRFWPATRSDRSDTFSPATRSTARTTFGPGTRSALEQVRPRDAFEPETFSPGTRSATGTRPGPRRVRPRDTFGPGAGSPRSAAAQRTPQKATRAGHVSACPREPARRPGPMTCQSWQESVPRGPCVRQLSRPPTARRSWPTCHCPR